MSRAAPRSELLLAALVAIPLSLAFTWTQVFPLDGVPVMGTDYGQLVWNMWIVDRAISNGSSPLSTDMIFHPTGTSLAAHVLTPAFFPVTMIVKAVRGADDLLYPMIAYKIAIALCYIAIAFATYAFLRRIGAGIGASIAVTIAYSFSAFNLLHAPHLNHLAVAAILPLSGWALMSAWQAPRLAPVLAIGFLFGAGPYFGELVAFVWVAFLALGAMVLLTRDRRAQSIERMRTLGGTRIGLSLVVAIVLVSPFALAWIRGGAAPMNARQAGFWSANLAAFVTPDPATQPFLAFLAPLHRMISKGVGGREAFLGFTLMICAAGGVLRIRDFWNRVCVLLALAFLVLSLGPTLKILGTETGVPMPYSFLMSIPPFSMGRTPVRCVLFVLFFLSIPAARFLGAIEARGRLGVIATVLAALAASAEMWSPRPLAPKFESPLDLKALVPGDVCNLPLTTLDGFAALLQTQHRRRIVTGVISRRSEAVAKHINDLGDLLDREPEKFASTLLSWGVTNVILEPGAPDVAPLLRPLGLNVIDLRGSAGRVQ